MNKKEFARSVYFCLRIKYINILAEAYSEPCQASSMECFAKAVNGFLKLFSQNTSV